MGLKHSSYNVLLGSPNNNITVDLPVLVFECFMIVG